MNIQNISQELRDHIVSLTEASKIIKAQELVSAIEKAIKKHFPKSTISVTFQRSLKPTEGTITVRFAVAGGKGEVTGGIMQNDISYTVASIWGMDGEGNLRDKIQFSAGLGGKIRVKTDDPRYAFSSIKVGLRKKTGTPEQVVKHIDNYFKKLLATIKANKDKLPDDDVEMLKSINLK